MNLPKPSKPTSTTSWPGTAQFIKKKDGFRQLNNWQQWSAVKKAILKNLKKKGMKSLVSWHVYRKELLGVG